MDGGAEETPGEVAEAPRRYPTLAVVLLALGIAGLLWSGIQEARRVRRPATADRMAPAFRMERFGGGTVDSSQLRGKVVMLDFWATWCGPCIAEMPTLLQLAAEYEPRGVVFLAASRDDPAIARAQVGIFIDQRAPALARFAVFADDETADAYGVSAIPTMALIDRGGRLRATYLGAASASTWRARIEAVLAQN